MTQALLDERSIEFWNKRQEQSTKGRWVRIVDEVPVTLEVDDWTIHRPDSKYGKNESIKTVDGRYFPVSAKYVTMLLKDLLHQHVTFTFTRFNSKPDSSQTYGIIDDIIFHDGN